MLKISEGRKNNRTRILQLEGSVVGPWAGELLSVADALLADNTKLELDLAGVSFADENGVAVLASLRRRRVKLRGPSPFVAEQLKAATAPGA